MSWLVSLVVMSALGATLGVKIAGVLFGDILAPSAVAAKNSLFVGTWTAITTALGVRGVKRAARKLRPSGADAHGVHPLKRKR